jgi:uncharacterized membrane protein YesL
MTACWIIQLIYLILLTFCIDGPSFYASFFLYAKELSVHSGRETVVYVKKSILLSVTSPMSLHGMKTFDRSD